MSDHEDSVPGPRHAPECAAVGASEEIAPRRKQTNFERYAEEIVKDDIARYKKEAFQAGWNCCRREIEDKFKKFADLISDETTWGRALEEVQGMEPGEMP